MKKMKFSRSMILVTLMASFLGACNNDDDEPSMNNTYTLTQVTVGGSSYTEIAGTINEDLTMQSGTDYILRDGVFVSSGNTLTIDAGVKIFGDKTNGADFLAISQGAKINAIGTASNPIVMTSFDKEKGSWGGLIINGYGTINSGTTAEGECGSGTYGGDNDADNSGTIKYLRIEYAGFICSTDDELNGLSLNGVGSGTTIEYVQAYKGADDGFEFFGGSANVKWAVSTGNKDDSFDWTLGWKGKGQFWVVEQDNVSGDRGIEADNNEDNNAATPYSNPSLSNMTFVGGTDADGENTGMRLRRGTKAKIHNTIVTGFPNNGIRVSDSQTATNMTDGSLLVANSVVFGNGTDFKDADTFLNLASNVTTAVTLSNGYVGTTAVNAVDPNTALDSWFTSANYIGAVQAGNDWTAGWTLKLDGTVR